MADMGLFRRTVPGEFEVCVLKDSLLQSEAKLYIECYETDETHDVSSLKVYSDTIKLGIPHCIPAKFTKSDLEKRILKCLEKIVETKTTTVAVNVDAVKTWNTTGFVYTLLKCFHDYALTNPKWVYLRLTVCSVQQQVCESAEKACAEFLSILNDNASEDAEEALYSVQDFHPSKNHSMGVTKEPSYDTNINTMPDMAHDSPNRTHEENMGASAGSVAGGSNKQTTIEGARMKTGGINLEHQGKGIIEKSDQLFRNEESAGTRKKDKYFLHNKTRGIEPVQQTSMRGLSGWTPEMLLAGPVSRIVIIEGIESGTSESSLSEQLHGFVKNIKLQLVFCETENEAHVMCDSDDDARSLLKHTLPKLKMKPHPRMILQHYTYNISKDKLQNGLLLDFFKLKIFTKPYFTYTEDQTGNLNVTSLTLYGVQYIKWSLEMYEYKSYSNVSELKYEVLMAKYGAEILGIGRTDGDIVFENGFVRLVCRKSCVGRVDKYIKTLLQFEGEKDFSIKTSDLEKTKELCKELVEDGYESVVTNKEGPKLIVLFETYDEITKVTKRVKSIQGKAFGVNQIKVIVTKK